MTTQYVKNLKKYLKTDEYDLTDYVISNIDDTKFFVIVELEHLYNKDLTASISITKHFNSIEDIDQNNKHTLDYGNRSVFLYKCIDYNKETNSPINKVHCETGPAYISYSDDQVVNKKYFLNGLNTNYLGLPDVKFDKNCSLTLHEWNLYDVNHRIEGPAYIYFSTKEKIFSHYYLGGIQLSEKDHKSIIDMVVENKLDFVSIAIDDGMYISNIYSGTERLEIKFLLDIAKHYNCVDTISKLNSILVLNALLEEE